MQLWWLLALAIALTACGGGGGGNPGSDGGGGGAPVQPQPQPEPGPLAWRAAALLETETQRSVSELQVVVDAKGRGIAVWSREEPPFARKMLVRHYTPGTGWSEPRVMDLSVELPNYFSPANAPRIAMAPDTGEAMLVWNQFDRTIGHEVVWSRNYAPGPGWGPVVRIGNGLPQADAVAGRPSVAINARGEAIAAWLQRESQNNVRLNLWGSRYIEGQWQAAVSLESSNFAVLDPQVAMTPTGEAIVAWQQGEQALVMLPAAHVWVNHLEADGNWSGPHQVDVEDDMASEPRLAMAPDGSVLLVWRAALDAGSDVSDLRASQYRRAEGWSATAYLNAAPTFLSGAQLAMDGRGHAMVLWHEFDPMAGPGLFDVWARRFDAVGLQWEPAQRLDGEAAGDAAMPAVGIDARGLATAVWVQTDGLIGMPAARFSVATTVWSPELGWTRPEVIHTNADGNMLFDPQIASSAHGTALAVWLQGDLPIPSGPPKPDLPWANEFR